MASDETLTAILAALQRLEHGQAEIGSGVDGLNSGFAVIKSEIAVIKSEIAELKSGLAELTKRVDRLEETQTQLRVDLMGRMDRLQHALTDIRNDITVNMGRADTAHNVAESTRAELRSMHETISGMGRQISSLQNKVRELRGDP